MKKISFKERLKKIWNSTYTAYAFLAYSWYLNIIQFINASSFSLVSTIVFASLSILSSIGGTFFLFKNNIPEMLKTRKSLKQAKLKQKEQERVYNEAYAKTKGYDYVLSKDEYKDITNKRTKKAKVEDNEDDCCL